MLWIIIRLIMTYWNIRWTADFNIKFPVYLIVRDGGLIHISQLELLLTLQNVSRVVKTWSSFDDELFTC